jgi:hypothetical protein
MEDSSPHNYFFSMKEMQKTLKTCVGSSPGPDDINYEMIKQLGERKKKPSWASTTTYGSKVLTQRNREQP